MSITEPKEALEALDVAGLEALDALVAHAHELSTKGPINLHVFRALWAEGLKATKGHAELLGTLRMFAPEGFEP